MLDSVKKLLKKFYFKFDIDYIFIFLFSVLFFSMILETGYYSDDSVNSYVKGLVYSGKYEHIRTFTWDVLVTWIKRGRLYPFTFYVYWLFSNFSTRFGYKLFLVFLIAANNLLFGYFTCDIWKSKWLSKIGMLIYPFFVPLVIFQDNAYVTIHGLIEIVFAEVILSLIFATKYIRNNKTWQMFLSCILFFISLMTYEIAFPYIFLFYILGYLNNDNIRIVCKKMNPILFTWLSAVMLQVLVRVFAIDKAYGGVTISLNPKLIITSFFKQVYALFPYVSYKYDNLIANIQTFDIALVLIFCLLIFRVTGIEPVIREQLNRKKTRLVLCVAGNFLFWPLLLLSISQKYQQLPWGIGYIINYFSTYGLLMTFMCVMYKMKINSMLRNILLCVVCCCIIVVTQVNCRSAIKIRNLGEGYYERETITDGIQQGLLKNINKDDLLVTTSSIRYDFYNPEDFYSCYAKKQINAIPFKSFVNYDDRGFSKVYFISTLANTNEGCIIIGENSEMQANDISNIIVNNAYINVIKGNIVGCIYKTKIDNYEQTEIKYFNIKNSRKILLGDGVKLKSIELIKGVINDWGK